MYIKGRVSICVNLHCLMLEVLRYIALNALNTVPKITPMSKMSSLDKVPHQGCKAMYVEDVEDGKEHTHTFWTHNLTYYLNGFSIRKKFWKAET